MADKIYCEFVVNPDKQAGDNRPAFIAPKNDARPDKNWTKFVKINNTIYNYAAFESKDMETGEIKEGSFTMIFTPSDMQQKSSGNANPGNTRGNYQQRSFANNNFAKKSNFGNKQGYRY